MKDYQNSLIKWSELSRKLSGSEWYARHHGFTDWVEWFKNHLTE